MIIHCKICNRDKTTEQFHLWRNLEKRKHPEAPAICKECHNKAELRKSFKEKDRYIDFMNTRATVIGALRFIPIAVEKKQNIATDIAIKKEVITTSFSNRDN
jgi:hypothetical protein